MRLILEILLYSTYFHQTKEAIIPVAYLNTDYSTVVQEKNESFKLTYRLNIWYVSLRQRYGTAKQCLKKRKFW